MHVTLPVKVDWSASGINTANLPATDEVSRVSIRFFPKDGSPAFDCYLDTDVTEGTIDVPPGRYGVVAFNESIYDDSWWEGRVGFSGTESYSDFAAHILPYDNALMAQQFPHYRPEDGELLVVEPLPLASWSLDEFEVTSDMATRGEQSDALIYVEMRPLTHRADIEADVENLASAGSAHGALKGLASTVLLASGRASGPSTHLFPLGERHYDPDHADGYMHTSFLSLGRTPLPESYRLEMDVLLADGGLHPDFGPLAFDVTGQVVAAGEGFDIPIHVEFTLPRVAGGIMVEEWGKDQEYTLN
jgi:hypothetical protein